MTVAGVTTLAAAIVVRVEGAFLAQEALYVRLAVTLSSAVVTVTGRAWTVAKTSCNVEGSVCLLVHSLDGYGFLNHYTMYV